MKFRNEALELQVNEPAAPPVEMMYFLPALTKADMLADAIVGPEMPPQLSLPHAPVANAKVMVLRLEGIAVNTD